MARATSAMGEKPNDPEIDEPAKESPDAVFGSTEPPRPMVDGDLADGETSLGGEHRKETVPVAVKVHLLDDLALHRFEAGVVIVQPDAGRRAHHEIERAARQRLVPRVLPTFFPTDD